MPSIPNSIQELLQPIAEAHHAFIVDIVLRGERTSKVIEAYVDTDTGISLDVCSEISRALSEKLDEADLIPGRYRLDVSSPGLDRPLKLLRQYHRNIGRTCNIKFLKEKETVKVEGKLETVSGDTVTVTKSGKQTVIPFAAIVETFVIPQIK